MLETGSLLVVAVAQVVDLLLRLILQLFTLRRIVNVLAGLLLELLFCVVEFVLNAHVRVLTTNAPSKHLERGSTRIGLRPGVLAVEAGSLSRRQEPSWGA